MRILHLTPSIDEFSGGLGDIALNLSKQHLAMGHEAEIWTYRTDKPEAPGVKCFPVRGPIALGWSPSAIDFAAKQSFLDSTVVHQHGIWTGLSLVTRRLHSKHTIPTLVAPQGSLEPYALSISPFKKRLALAVYEGSNLKEAHCLQATCIKEAEHFRGLGLVNPIALIPNSIEEAWLDCDIDDEHPSQFTHIPPDRTVILFLSRLHPKKGLEILLHAFARLKKTYPKYCLAVVGYGDQAYELTLQNLCSKLSISSDVHFLGSMQGYLKRKMFAASSLFVLPTQSDNFAIVICEALGAGLPTITTTEAPWQELRDNDCGWWTPPTVEGVYAALVEFAKCPPETLSLMGQRGRDLVRRKYTTGRVAEQCIQVYKWLACGDVRPKFILG